MAGLGGSEYKMVQVLREVQLMMRLRESKEGRMYVPDVYDVFVHEEEQQHGVK